MWEPNCFVASWLFLHSLYSYVGGVTYYRGLEASHEQKLKPLKVSMTIQQGTQHSEQKLHSLETAVSELELKKVREMDRVKLMCIRRLE